MDRHLSSLSLLGIVFVSAQSPEPDTMTFCTPSIEPAITVTVSDAQTNLPLEAKVVVQKQNFQEELQLSSVTPAGQFIYGGVFERPGVYTVSTSSDGYETSVLEKVEVTQGECHVLTRHLQVRLKPVKCN